MLTMMSLLMTAKAVGVDPGDYFKDARLRIATCSDVKQLTPHGWKEHFAAKVKARRYEILQRLVATA